LKALKVLLSLAVTFGMFVGFLEALVVLGLLQIPGLLSWRTANADMDASLLHWIDGLDGRPFFAFVNYLDVHGPFIPPEQFRGTFSSDQPPSAQIGMDLGALAGEMALPPTEVIQDRLNRYDESILAWDAAFGDLQHDLETRGLLENTLIIVTSDHGESFGERGLFNHGHSLYREQVDIPLVLSWPAGIRQPRKDSNPVGLDQVPATLLDAAGLPQGGFPGLSLLNTHEALLPRFSWRWHGGRSHPLPGHPPKVGLRGSSLQTGASFCGRTVRRNSSTRKTTPSSCTISRSATRPRIP
jgi:hypothetical protein